VGEIEAARQLADHVYRDLDKLPPRHREPGLLILVRAWLAQERAEEALETLAALRSSAEQAGRSGSLIEILVLQSLALHWRGDGSRASQTLLAGLELAEPEGYARVFIDEGEPVRRLLVDVEKHGAAGRYARTLLAQFPPVQGSPRGSHSAPTLPTYQGAPAAQPLSEPLTGRERDVLRLLAAGLSGPEIASALVMTQNTVKTHLKNLYGKLDVRSRDQALQRARELDLL
jgi:LuxR family maltose regulon positive regulatory protein